MSDIKLSKHKDIIINLKNNYIDNNSINKIIYLKNELMYLVEDVKYSDYLDAVDNHKRLRDVLYLLADTALKASISLLEVKNERDVYNKTCEYLHRLYTAKNHDYGDSFGETYERLGIISAVTRITDKINRYISLSSKEQMVQGESIIDTLQDLANYCIMTIIELELREDIY